MADAKLSALTQVTTADSADLLYGVDVSDTTDGPGGSSRAFLISGLVPSLSITMTKLAKAARPTVNLLINGGFDFAQRQTPATLTSYANGAYGLDRWYVLGNSGATDIQVARVDESGSGNSHYSGQIKNNNAGTKYVGLAQALEHQHTIPLRGRPVIFQFNAKASSSRNLRAAIVEWTGTGDTIAFGGAVGKDPVNTWTSTNYTAGNFFRSTSFTLCAVSGSLAATSSYATFSVTGTVSSSANNLIVMVWDESATPIAGTFNLREAGLYDGAVERDWQPRSLQDELALCRRYYEKSYNVDIAPGTVSGDGFWHNLGPASGTSAIRQAYPYRVEKRVTPTVAIYDFDGNVGKCNRGAADKVATVAIDGTTNVTVICSDATSAQGIGFHVTAAAEL